jgi:hypothetical protein
MRSSGVRRINYAVRRLDWALVENALNPSDGSDGAPFELCAATLDDWSRYVQSEQQALGSRWMAWWDDKVFIVELARGPLHENLVQKIRGAISVATGTGEAHLESHGAARIDNLAILLGDINALIALLQPDASFGPVHGLHGAVLPPGFSWGVFHTLKVEIGVSRGWGPPIQQQGEAGRQGQALQQGQQRQAGQQGRRLATLNEKADAWRQCPGVEYVLSIRVSPGLLVREFRLDSIVNGQFEDPDMQHAPIDDTSVVQFDPWRLLGIPAGAALPAGFNNPVAFNLFDVVDPIIQHYQEDVAQEQALWAQAAAAADDDDGQPPRCRQRHH